MRILFSLFLALTLSQSVIAAECSLPDNLPQNFEIEEKLLRWTTTLELKEGGQSYGQIVRKAFTWGATFDYKYNGETLITAREKIWSFGTVIEVFDCQNAKIGELRERVWESLFKIQTTYEVLDAAGNVIALSKKLDWWDTEFVVYDQANNAVARFFRAAFQWFGDKWDVDIYSADFDQRLLIFIPAFKTYVDNLREQDSDN